MVGLIDRMRLFAPPEVVNGAEAILRSIVEISLELVIICAVYFAISGVRFRRTLVVLQ